MYRDKMISVAKIENGFIIEVAGRFKLPKEGKGGKDDKPMFHSSAGYGEKELFAKDATDLAQKIEALMPMLEVDEFGSEEDFDKAFNEAAKK